MTAWSARLGALVAVVGSGHLAHASGMAFGIQSASAAGRAGAVIASPLDASIGFYNVAGLAELRGVNVSLGGTILFPSRTFADRSQAYDTTLRGVFIPNLFVSYRRGSASAGFGSYTPYRHGSEWPDGYPGANVYQRGGLSTQRTFQFSFSWRFSSQISVGAALTFGSASLTSDRKISLGPLAPGTASIQATAAAVGAVAAVLVTPWRSLRIGLQYRSPRKFSFEGSVEVASDLPNPPGTPIVRPVTSELTTPHVLSIGIAYEPSRDLTVEIDVDTYLWSVLQERCVTFGPSINGGASDVFTDCVHLGWHDASTFKFGVEWRKKWWALRAGYSRALTPVPESTQDLLTVGSNMHAVSVGVGFSIGENFQIDFAWWFGAYDTRRTLQRFTENDVTVGLFGAAEHILALNFGMRL